MTRSTLLAEIEHPTKTIGEIETSDPQCKRCDGTGWVCENHPNVPWAGMTGEPFCRSAVEGCGGAGMPCPDCNRLAEHVSLIREIESGSSREYWRAFNAAHADAYRSRVSSDPALAEHYAALAHVGFGYARALRTGDWSKTSIRPLSHFIPAFQRSAA